MKKLLTLGVAALLAVTFDACKKKGADAYAGIEGDYVTGTPLPDRLEGANFFGSNVTRGQFSPVYFGYDSFSVSGSELEQGPTGGIGDEINEPDTHHRGLHRRARHRGV